MPTKKTSATKKKKKHPKMERLLVSKEKHELKHVAKKTGKSQKVVREAQKKTRSRKKIMEALSPDQKKVVKKLHKNIEIKVV